MPGGLTIARLSPLMKKLIDIREYPEAIDAMNAVLNNDGIAEVKNEKRHGEVNLVVVEISRKVRTKKP